MIRLRGLMLVLTPFRGYIFISKKSFGIREKWLYLCPESATKLNHQNHHTMNKVHNNRVDLLKEVKTTVNTLFFAPSEQRRKEALASLDALRSFVEAVEVSKPKATAAKPKASTQPKAVEMYELFQQFLAEQGVAVAADSPKEVEAAKPKAKRPVTPRKPKASKPTKTRRPSRNEKLEAQAQKLSLKAAEDRAIKNAPKEVVVCDGKPTEASPFGTRKSVVDPEIAKAAKAAAAQRAARQAALLAEQEALAAMTAEQLDLFLDDSPF